MSLDNMKKRVEYIGGNTSDGRNVRLKWLSFRSAQQNGYQPEWITLDKEEDGPSYRCLINPDKLKTDYDQKIISIDFNAGMKEGDTFCWTRTGTHWIAYLQHFEEEAYFRSEIRRCDYAIEVNGHKYWIYLRGPVETALVWRQKHGISYNDMNYSIMFYIQKNEETLKYFSRLQKIKFDGHNWRVATTDKYSQDNLIEVYLEEYFDNSMEDAAIEPEVVEIQDETQPYIDGPQSVKPYDTNVRFEIKNANNGIFVVNSSKVKVIKTDETSCVLEIMTGKSGKFKIDYQNDTEIITSLDVEIKSF